ncbi:Phosphate-binding protein PstS 3 [Arthrobacter sp. SO5]|nr:Phosphate-binding protein PstS 3 [Arthrobacter sp. SO5]
MSIAYSPDGAEVGKTALTNGLSYFAAGDVALDSSTASNGQSACGRDGLISVPVAVVPVGVAFNLGEIRSLQLNGSLLSGILQGKITKWNDPELAAANPGVPLPSIDVVPILEKSPSDVTRAVNKYLATEAPGSWPDSSGSEWPSGTVRANEDKVTDVARKVDDTQGAITVLDTAIIGSRFSVARLQFGGVYQDFGNESTMAAIAAGETVQSVPRVVEQRLDGSKGYALAVLENQYFCTRYGNDATASLVRSWGESVLSRQGQRDAVVYSSSLPPSEPTTAAALKQVRAITSDKR